MVHRLRWQVAWIALVALLPVPVLSGLASPAYLAVSILIVGVGWLIARLEDAPHRSTFLGLIGLALLVRLVALAALTWLGRDAGGPFLGPDSSDYLLGSDYLARHDFVIPSHPAFFFGSFDSAHYYLFGALIRAFGADLFALQWFSCGLTAMVGAMMFSWSRITLDRRVPGSALAIGVLLAVHPSLVVLSATDLLKDPPILFCMAAALWTLTRLSRRDVVRAGVGGLFVVAVLALVYLRMDRFYTVVYLELALLVVACAWWIGRAQVTGVRRGALALAGVIGLAELIPFALAWPPSPVLFARNVGLVLDTPVLREYAPGLVDSALGRQDAAGSVARSGGPMETIEEKYGGTDFYVNLDQPNGRVTGTVVGWGHAFTCDEVIERFELLVDGEPWPDVTFTTRVPRPDLVAFHRRMCGSDDRGVGFRFPFDADRLEYGRHRVLVRATTRGGRTKLSNIAVPEIDTSGAALPIVRGTRQSLWSRLVADSQPGADAPRPAALAGPAAVAFLGNLFRRVYGPFVWILPARWNAREILTSDYLLYPGMLVWYVLVPFMVVGLVWTGWMLASSRSVDAALAVLWIFTLGYGAQYLALNLSYRQRDILFPFLLVFAVLGVHAVRDIRSWKLAYGLYWLGLIAIAAAHLVVRARVA